MTAFDLLQIHVESIDLLGTIVKEKRLHSSERFRGIERENHNFYVQNIIVLINTIAESAACIGRIVKISYTRHKVSV